MEEEIKKYLKKHLSVQVSCDRERGDISYVEVKLLLDDEVISSDFD